MPIGHLDIFFLSASSIFLYILKLDSEFSYWLVAVFYRFQMWYIVLYI